MAGWEERFGDYIERLGEVLGHADRRAPLRSYTAGVYLPPVSTTWPVTARRIRVWTTSSLAWRPASASTMAGLDRGTPSPSSPRTPGAVRATMALMASEPARS